MQYVLPVDNVAKIKTQSVAEHQTATIKTEQNGPNQMREEGKRSTKKDKKITKTTTTTKIAHPKSMN